MTREEIEREIADLESYIKYKQDSIDSTLARYGSGVRPGWVSADLSIDGAHIANARRQIKELQSKLEAETQQ